MKEASPQKQLADFIAKFTPEVAAIARAALKKMRARLPGAIEMVYDNYNALAIGFSPTDRVSDAVFSIALYPKWVTLFFLRGATLRDPEKVLTGSGHVVRNYRLTCAEDLDRPEIVALMDQALSREHPFDASRKNHLVIKAISAKQRPRRPLR